VKLSDLTPEEWYQRLNTKRMLQRRSALYWWQYVNNEQPLVYVARILAEQGDRFPPLLINWSELVLSAVNDRLFLETFMLTNDDGTESPVDDLDTLLQMNDLDEGMPEAFFASMVSGQSFLMIGPGDDEWPLVTAEYEDEVAVEINPRTRQPWVGLKVWQQERTVGGETLGSLVLPDGRAFEFVNGEVDTESTLDWVTGLDADPRMPSVPFVPLLTNPRRGRGQSDLVSLRPLVDGANQFATNMMAAGEHHAVPRKWALNVSEKDFVDDNGNQIPLWKVAMGDAWAIPPMTDDKGRLIPNAPEPKLGQFSASDLRNFHESVKMIATIAGSLYGLPPGYMGYSSDNPPSAESILYSLERLVLRAGKRQLWYGGAAERAARIAWVIRGEDPKELAKLEASWRNAATPTMASMMDAAVKGVQAGIIDDEQAWVDLRYSRQTIKGLRERKAARGPAVNAALRDLDALPTTLPTPGTNGAPVLRS
jgi:hypothetical protein